MPENLLRKNALDVVMPEFLFLKTPLTHVVPSKKH